MLMLKATLDHYHRVCCAIDLNLTKTFDRVEYCKTYSIIVEKEDARCHRCYYIYIYHTPMLFIKGLAVKDFAS